MSLVTFNQLLKISFYLAMPEIARSSSISTIFSKVDFSDYIQNRKHDKNETLM